MRVAPDAGAVLGDGKVEALGGERHVLGARLDEREHDPGLLLAAAGGRELRRGDVDADGPGAALREPGRDVRGAAAELDDVEAVDVAEAAERSSSGTSKTPQVISSSAHFALARASVYSAFAFVQSSRLRLASSEISGIGEMSVPGIASRGTAQSRPSGKNSDSSRLRARLRVGAVHDVLREQRREVAADRAGRRVGGIGRAHHRADAGDRVLAADGEGEDGAGRDERDELAEEGLALVLGVVLLREGAGDLQEAGAAQLVAATLEAGDDLAAEPAADAVRLDEDECGFGGHRGGSLVDGVADALPGVSSCAARGAAAGPRRRARAPGGTVVAQYGQTCQIGSSGAPHELQACLRRVVQTGQTRNEASTWPRQTGQRRSRSASRSSSARFSSSRSRRSSIESGGRRKR